MKKPIDYFDILDNGVFNKLIINKNITLKDKVLDIYVIDRKGYDSSYFLDNEYKALVYSQTLQAENNPMTAQEKDTWIHKGRWVQDFYKLASKLEKDKALKGQEEKERVKRILDNY